MVVDWKEKKGKMGSIWTWESDECQTSEVVWRCAKPSTLKPTIGAFRQPEVCTKIFQSLDPEQACMDQHRVSQC